MKHPLIFPISDTDKARFFSKLGAADENGCRNFLGGQCEGYGRVWLQNDTRQAHYIAFAIAKGRIPMKDVLQTCHNKLCCESSHLIEGQGNLTTPRNLRQRFEAKFIKLTVDHPTLPGPCWKWTGATDESGYATMGYQGRQMRASHLSLLIYKDETRQFGLDCCHGCDYPLCVNPDHVRFDTPEANGHDKVIRNRTAKGAKHGAYTKPESRRRGRLNGRAKLTDRDVCVIRRTCDAHPGKRGLLAALARKFRVDITTVDAVQRRKKWQCVAEDAFPSARALAVEKLCSGRAKGEESPRAKLKARTVREIRFIHHLCGDVHGLVVTLVKLYRKKIGRTHVLRVLRRETWPHVKDCFHRVSYVRRWFAMDAKRRRTYTLSALKAGPEFMSP